MLGNMTSAVKPKRDFLRSVGLFERLPNPALDRLAMAFEHHVLGDGEVVFRQGDRGDRLYLVEAGTVDLIRGEGSSAHRLARIETGGYFGELALLSDNPRAATAKCVGESELLSISGRDLKRLVAESAPALRGIIGAIKEYRPPEGPPSLWQRLRGQSNEPKREPKRAARQAKPPEPS